MVLPEAIENFIRAHAPELLEPKGPTPPATLLAPDKSPVKVEELKKTIQTNIVNMNASIDKMVATLKEVENTKYASEMNRLSMVFLQKAKSELSKHFDWMKTK